MTSPNATQTADAPVLQGQALTYSYDSSTQALAGVDLAVRRRESLAIMGPSGCGKSTLLHVLAGILPPASGRVTFQGGDLGRLSDGQRTMLRRNDFGFVFQDGQLLPELTARENVMLPRMLAGVSKARAKDAAGTWLSNVGLADFSDRKPGQLSGGQAQRVAIARALAGQPSVVFADEPTGALDQATGQAVLATLLEATAAANAGLIMVTHDPNVARACHRTVMMRDGLIVQEFSK